MEEDGFELPSSPIGTPLGASGNCFDNIMSAESGFSKLKLIGSLSRDQERLQDFIQNEVLNEVLKNI